MRMRSGMETHAAAVCAQRMADIAFCFSALVYKNIIYMEICENFVKTIDIEFTNGYNKVHC